MDTEIKIINKEEWMELCRKYHKWCNWTEARELTPEEVEFYIKTMPCWSAMEREYNE